MKTVNLGTLTFLTLKADASTPAAYLPYADLRLTVPEGIALPALGEYASLTASGVTVFGYTRLAADGSLEWLMTPQQDPSLVEVDKIPGVGGWTDQPARTGYLNQANFLLGVGVTGAQLWPGLKNFYQWALADLVAKGWKAPGA